MLFPALSNFVATLDPDAVSQTRREMLAPLIAYVQAKVSEGKSVRLNMICTHNSRRSHLAQVWAQTAAFFYEIPQVTCYSGGTETTAMHPAIVETLKDAGFEISTMAVGDNPLYAVKFAPDEHPVIGFSKWYDDGFNPNSGFAAVMTCSHADEGCPFIAGAEKRISLPYDDPKTSDGTPEAKATYRGRSMQIASEMMYVFSRIKTI